MIERGYFPTSAHEPRTDNGKHIDGKCVNIVLFDFCLLRGSNGSDMSKNIASVHFS